MELRNAAGGILTSVVPATTTVHVAGDRLTSTVDYSADAGRHWKVVAGDVSASTAT